MRDRQPLEAVVTAELVHVRKVLGRHRCRSVRRLIGNRPWDGLPQAPGAQRLALGDSRTGASGGPSLCRVRRRLRVGAGSRRFGRGRHIAECIRWTHAGLVSCADDDDGDGLARRAVHACRAVVI